MSHVNVPGVPAPGYSQSPELTKKLHFNRCSHSSYDTEFGNIGPTLREHTYFDQHLYEESGSNK